jgi:hypothetical protein
MAAGSDASYALVAKSNGAKQCQPGHASLAAMRAELDAAGIAVALAACGADGMARPAVCGADAGEIGIFGIPQDALDPARALGFAPLSELPDATRTPCRDKSDAAAEFADAAEGSIFGIGPAVDGAAYRKVRALIGKAIAQGAVDSFFVYGYGIEGGFSFCAQRARFASANDFAAFVRKLRAVRPDPNTTSYAVNFAPACSQPDQ